MGYLARCPMDASKVDVLGSVSGDLVAAGAANAFIWVGDSVPRHNAVELETTILRCWSLLKERFRFVPAPPSNYMLGYGALSAVGPGITVAQVTAIGFTNDNVVAFGYGESFANMPANSQGLESCRVTLTEWLNERAWPVA